MLDKIKIMTAYKISHSYDIGDQSIIVLARNDLDMGKAVAYIQFMAEEISGDSSTEVQNQEMVNILTELYGCEICTDINENLISIDLYEEREMRTQYFYGDNSYFNDVQKTIEQLTKTLANVIARNLAEQS